MHLAVLLWGFTGILGRAISLSAPVLVWYRMLLASAILGGIIFLRRKGDIIERKDRLKLIGIGVMYAIHWLCFYGSIKLANASIAVVCLATASVFIAIFDPLINKGRIKAAELLIGGIALGGVLCIYLLHRDAPGNATQPMKHFRLGLWLGLLAAVISAVFTAFNKPLAEKYTARPLVFWEMISGFAFVSCLLPFYFQWQPGEAFLPTGWDYLWIFLLGYCCTVWGQSLAMAALKHLSAFTTTISVNLEPVYGIILAFLIFRENAQLGYGFYIGMILIFLSVSLQIILSIRQGRERKKALRSELLSANP
ncbi:MAG TPA: DMT family transporter [Edaphocola sp.]|nr:DMT family transporter [Edaphocola sp.]